MSDHGHAAHHHKESFFTKYVFSQDHKMIAKQYLLTAIIMGIVGIALSALFRLQLGWPDEKFGIMEDGRCSFYEYTSPGQIRFRVEIREGINSLNYVF